MILLLIKEIAEAKGFNQQNLARAAEVDINVVRRIFRNPNEVVTTTTLDKLAQALNVDVSSLLRNEPPLPQFDKHTAKEERLEREMRKSIKKSGRLKTQTRLKVKEAAQAKGINRVQLGEMANIDERTMARIYAHPTTNITTETLDRIAKALEADAAQLIESVSDE